MQLFRFCLIGIVYLSMVQASWAEEPVKANQEIAKVDSVLSLVQKNRSGNFAKTLNDLFYAENIAKSIDYTAGLANSYFYQGNVLYQNGFYQKSILVYFEALDQYRKLNNRQSIALTKTAIFQLLMENHWEATVNQAYLLAIQLPDQDAKSSDNIKAQISLGALYAQHKFYDSAVNVLNLAKKASMQANNLEGLAYAQYQIGMVAYQQQNYSVALSSLNNAYLLANQQKFHHLQLLIQLAFGKVSLGESQWTNAIDWFQKANQLAQDLSITHHANETAKELLKAYSAIGNTQMANVWKDSLLNQLSRKGSTEESLDKGLVELLQNQAMQLSETNKVVAKQKEVQKNQLFIITVGTFVLIIVAVLAVLALVNYQRQRYFSKELKNKNEIIQANVASLDLLNKEISSQNQLLEADNKTKNKLLSIISHDLRSPLVNTKGVLNLVNQGMIPPEESKRLLQVLETQYLGTTSLLDNLLFWIRGQMDGKVEETVSIKLADLIKSLATEHELMLSNKKITFYNQIPENIIVQQEKELLRIVCRNLMSNAIKFTNLGGSIEMDAIYAEKGRRVLLTIKDNGIGMSEETISKVLTKQYYNTPGTNNERGSGFGLMLCQDLLKKNGGVISIKSELGKGTAITIIL